MTISESESALLAKYAHTRNSTPVFVALSVHTQKHTYIQLKRRTTKLYKGKHKHLKL